MNQGRHFSITGALLYYAAFVFNLCCIYLPTVLRYYTYRLQIAYIRLQLSDNKLAFRKFM